MERDAGILVTLFQGVSENKEIDDLFDFSGTPWQNNGKKWRKLMYRNGIKRLLAIVLSLCGMVCLSWLFLILAVAIKLDSPGPVFFKQKRVGIGKKHFYILKFRTMRIDTPRHAHAPAP